MTDGELLVTAANRSSFIDLAQQTLSEELARRKLVLPAEARPPETAHAPGVLSAAIHKLLLSLRHNKVHN
jgi:hypothetical protein